MYHQEPLTEKYIEIRRKSHTLARRKYKLSGCWNIYPEWNGWKRYRSIKKMHFLSLTEAEVIKQTSVVSIFGIDADEL